MPENSVLLDLSDIHLNREFLEVLYQLSGLISFPNQFVVFTSTHCFPLLQMVVLLQQLTIVKLVNLTQGPVVPKFHEAILESFHEETVLFLDQKALSQVQDSIWSLTDSPDLEFILGRERVSQFLEEHGVPSLSDLKAKVFQNLKVIIHLNYFAPAKHVHLQQFLCHPLLNQFFQKMSFYTYEKSSINYQLIKAQQEKQQVPVEQALCIEEDERQGRYMRQHDIGLYQEVYSIV